MQDNTLLWKPRPSEAAVSQMAQFLHFINHQYNQKLTDYPELHFWSISHTSDFWLAVWNFMKIIAIKPPREIFIQHSQMQKSQWFQGATLNFAENLLRYRDDRPALIFRRENGDSSRFTYHELYDQVKALTNWMRQSGIQPGDRVAGWMSNSPETVIIMLAAASLGAIWSVCSSDFGLQGVLDRFTQIEPKFLFAADSHIYGGKTFHHLKEIQLLQQQLPSLHQTVIVPATGSHPDLKTFLLPVNAWQDCLIPSSDPLIFTPLPFNHPLYILYSSGTTDKPKCMVHGAGGTLLQHLKELRLHTDLRREDTLFFYTTCAWMMWHWSISALAAGATVVLYEGSPFYPQKTALFDLIDECGVSVLGAGAKIFESAQKWGLCPRESHSLSTLRTILTTGSPLLPESFDYIYGDIKAHVCLSSISGGSDIISCFALGTPLLPVYRGELQCLGLGMDVKIFNEQGEEVHEKGELVCIKPFPSMPVCFWNDPLGEKYQHAYFDRFPGVWNQGDYAQITPHGGLIIYGRSDATLNPAGIRIGPAELYQPMKKFSDVLDCLAVGHHTAAGEEIILFVTLTAGHKLTQTMINAFKTSIRHHLSAHHVPAKIIQAPDLPRTLNGKIMEVAVKKIINHEPLIQTEALANPDSLEFFKSLNFK